ncbi:DUF6931 family protein [Acidocella sp.]|uniref:DUF6931 family protein n=1 Tax=Acidocella sp. TaxID=50710 RepID=UPI002620B1F2|nr:hypothetical protein [Acidocella sp.]
MSATMPNKLAAADMASVLQRCDLPPEALAVAQGQGELPGMIDALAAAGFLVEASRVFAHALPRREAVWWACMCATHTAAGDIPPEDNRMRELAETWVRQQSDEIRRANMENAKRAGFQSPEAWAAVAAFWSGGSITAPDAPPVPAPPHLPGVAVAGAVALASVRGAPNRQMQRLALFLRSAHDIALGGQGRLPVEAG